MEEEVRRTSSGAKPIEVGVSVQGGTYSPNVQIPIGATVEAALRAAKETEVIEQLRSGKGLSIRVSGQPAKLDTVLQDGQAVIVTQQIKGGC